MQVIESVYMYIFTIVYILYSIIYICRPTPRPWNDDNEKSSLYRRGDIFSFNTKNKTYARIHKYIIYKKQNEKSLSNLDARKRIPVLYTLNHEDRIFFSFCAPLE